ncbi:rho GTPase-activating protein SYDE2 [Scleropages formosus]|uniref:rho GTPase-activating protein SYDE2 n=1 Tax=Scleropages formosus TaxID=113540 RepID=UPI0010FACD70|nr:rho GTPase-activating protein SYDE2 [Scleropages formosus]
MADPLRRTLLAKLRGKKPKATAFGDHRVLIKNVHNSITETEDAGVSGFAKTSDLLNAAAVSERSHWLQQTPRKDHAVEEDLVCFRLKEGHASHTSKTDGLLPSPLISSSPEAQHPYLDTLTLQPHLQQLRVDSSDRHNDVDGEGEIWYNPIPEDDDPEPAQAPESPVTLVPSGSDTREVCRPCMSNLQDYLDGRGHDVSSENSTYSMEPVKKCRQTPLPRTTTPDATEVAFSLPSSPSSSKKAGSISWSFPDKIKSPRTMRKLSMKMRRLPELGRKLSVKGTYSSDNSQSEPQQSSPKANPKVEVGHSPLTVHGQIAASRNVISRYHLDSSVSTQHDYSQETDNCSKSANKGGYLSDGDSPELVTKSGKRRLQWKPGRRKESRASNSPRRHGVEMDFDTFHHYNFIEQSKCNQFISGLMSLHLCGAKDLKPSYADSHSIYCAIQVDLVNKARTAVLTCRTTFLDMDHTFHIQLEEAQRLTLVVFSWESDQQRHRVCCHGTVALPELFQVTGPHRLAVHLEPRGIIYVKLSLMEQQQSLLDGPEREYDSHLFGVDASHVVEQENTGSLVPLIIKKCISEIERRGCQVVGLYRLCGSAAAKKDLREAFERDSHTVVLSEEHYPDINVITGVLKDYLRELPSPLISEQLYGAVLDSMTRRPLRISPKGCENDPADSQHAVSLLTILPQVERATLQVLLDHLKLVASHQESNRMTCQNLAVCFGPVLLGRRQEASRHANRVFSSSKELASALHFKKHIEVLHYLLQLWPVVYRHKSAVKELHSEPAQLRRRRGRPQALNLRYPELAGVLRSSPGRLDSPSNRYAGDWSLCRENYLQPTNKSPREEADYDDVPWEDMDGTECQREPNMKGHLEPQLKYGEEEEGDAMEVEEKANLPDDHPGRVLTQNRLVKENTYRGYMTIKEISPVLSNRLNLNELQQSIDNLIGNLERELNKNKLNVGY